MRKDEDDKLIKGIRERLRDYSESIPNGSWSSLEKELNGSQVHFRPVRRMIVAASFLIIALASISLWLLNTPIEKCIPEVASVPISLEEQKQQIGIETQQIVPQLKKIIISKTTASIGDEDVRKMETKEEKEEITVESSEVVEDAVVIIEDKSINEVSKTEKMPVTKTEKNIRRNQYKETQERNARTLASLNRKDYKKWTVGVSYGNSSGVENTGIPGFSTLDIRGNLNAMNMLPTNTEGNCFDEGLKKTKPFKRVLANNIGKEPITDIKHKAPVTMSLSFRYSLSRNFAIETGLTYTMLSSELKSGSETDFYIEEYKLHYLGIPLKGNLMLLNRKYLSLYLSAGGAIEKSVAGKYKITYVTNDQPDEHWNENVTPVQWSVSAAVGVQFNATEHFGIYVEPGVIHYFDDGSNVETIRKEKPTNFNLQLGLRWTY